MMYGFVIGALIGGLLWFFVGAGERSARYFYQEQLQKELHKNRKLKTRQQQKCAECGKIESKLQWR